jgi:hypothetical protein
MDYYLRLKAFTLLLIFETITSYKQLPGTTVLNL